MPLLYGRVLVADFGTLSKFSKSVQLSDFRKKNSAIFKMKKKRNVDFEKSLGDFQMCKTDPNFVKL